MALMTPIVKAGLTDLGSEATNLALGVFGGARLHPRDAAWSSSCATRASRRSTRARTACRRSTWSAGSCRRAPAACCAGSSTPPLALLDEACGDERLADIAGAGAAPRCDRLRRVDAVAGASTALADREEAGAAATEYLRLFHLTALGVLWVRMARAALSATTTSAPRSSPTARFYAARMLPETSGAGAPGDGGQGDADGAARAPVLTSTGLPVESRPADTAPVRVPRSLRLPLVLRARVCASSRRVGSRSGSEPTAASWPGRPGGLTLALLLCSARGATGRRCWRQRRRRGARDRLRRRVPGRSAWSAWPRRTCSSRSSAPSLYRLAGAHRDAAGSCAGHVTRCGSVAAVHPRTCGRPTSSAATAVVAGDMTEVSRATAWISFTSADSVGIITTLPFFLALAATPGLLSVRAARHRSAATVARRDRRVPVRRRRAPLPGGAADAVGGDPDWARSAPR